MGKADAKQSKLTFEGCRTGRCRDPPHEAGEQATQTDAPEVQDEDIRSLLLEVKSSLKTIDSKIDHLASHLDQVKQRVDSHDTCITQLEAGDGRPSRRTITRTVPILLQPDRKTLPQLPTVTDTL